MLQFLRAVVAVIKWQISLSKRSTVVPTVLPHFPVVEQSNALPLLSQTKDPGFLPELWLDVSFKGVALYKRGDVRPQCQFGY